MQPKKLSMKHVAHKIHHNIQHYSSMGDNLSVGGFESIKNPQTQN